MTAVTPTAVETDRDLDATATKLVTEHAASFNQGVRSGDFGLMLERFAPDAEMRFDGVPVGPFRGQDAIAEAYRLQPPDDTMTVLDVSHRDGRIVAGYAWDREPETRAGELLIREIDGAIRSLIVSFARPIVAEEIRRDFPIFERDFGGKRLAYLDSAATSLKPRAVIDAVDGYNTRYTANVHRGIYTTGEEATAAYEGARVKAAYFINAPDSHEVVFVRNATEAINLIAYSWGRRHIGQADTILLTEMEHHANLVPWQLLTQEKDADLEFVPFDEQGRLNQRSFEVLLRTRPKLVAFTHVSNGIGTINPVREMVAAAHDAGALVLVDGAQAVPHGPVDVVDLDCDFYVFSGHKVLGPTGSGVLWGRRELLDAMPPFMGGGEMIREVHLRRTEFNDVPWKFEAGTPDIAAAIGLGAALDYLRTIGMHNVRTHERELTEFALDLLPSEVPGIRIYGPASADERAGIVTFNLPDIHPHDVATLLDREAIAIRAGHHCTQPLHERMGEAATARASFNVYSGRDDIERLAVGLRNVQRVFSREQG